MKLQEAIELLKRWLNSEKHDPYEVVCKDKDGHALNATGKLRMETREFLNNDT